jgi:transposase
MPAKVYIVDLTEEERQEVLALLRKGKTGARKITRARILLKADEGLKDAEIARALNTSPSTVERTRKRFVEGGLAKALNEDPRPGRVPKLGEREEAHLIALACSDAPDGHEHWTLRMLADKVVELGFAVSFSHEAVRQRLKKMS